MIAPFGDAIAAVYPELDVADERPLWIGAREACRFETCLHSPDGPEKALTPRRLVGLGHYLAAIHEPDPGHAPRRRSVKQARVDLRAQTVRAQQLEVSGHFLGAARPEHSHLDARGLPTLNVSAHQF
jgi:hypothetical protein